MKTIPNEVINPYLKPFEENWFIRDNFNKENDNEPKFLSTMSSAKDHMKCHVIVFMKKATDVSGRRRF